jgi:RNA polymerase sigma factor (sigma-70 family)
MSNKPRSNTKGKGHYGTGKYDTDWKRHKLPIDRLVHYILEEQHTIDSESATAIYGMLGKLPPREAEILKFRVSDLLSYRAIAARLGCYQNNVKYLEHQALTRMREWVVYSLQLPNL